MKKMIMTLVCVVLLSVAATAQEREEKNKNSGRQSETRKGEQSAQDTTQDLSPHDLTNKNKVPPTSDPSGSQSDDNGTVKPGEKRNLPGNRTQADETERGKKRDRSGNDDPHQPD